MYPTDHCKPYKYLYDDFDSDIPLHCYWDARFADSAYPANDGGSYYAIKLRSPEWSNTLSNLVFPTYTWLSTPAYPIAKNLVIKVDRTPLPYTFQLAFKFSQIDNYGTLTYPEMKITGYGWLSAIETDPLKRYLFSWDASLGNAAYANNSFVVGDDIYYSFSIDAAYNCVYDFKINGVTPTPVSGWAPGVSKLANSTNFNSLMSSFPDYIPLRLYPRGGGKLDYLEMKIAT